MAESPHLTDKQLTTVREILDRVRAELATLAGDDQNTLHHARRHLMKRLEFDERGRPGDRKDLKLTLMAKQQGKCAICREQLPTKGSELDRKDAVLGYIEGTVDSSTMTATGRHRRQRTSARVLHKPLKRRRNLDSLLGVSMFNESSAIHRTRQERLSEQALALYRLLNDLPQNPAVTDTLDYILGAFYGLYRADASEFKDRSTAYVPEYHAHLANYAINLAEGKGMDSVWTAGFFFNSGIQRLAAAFDRVPKMLGADSKKRMGSVRKPTTAKERMTAVNPVPHRLWEKVYDEVNEFKHSPEGLAAGRSVTMDDAVSACAEVLDLLERSKEAITQKFPEPLHP